MKGLILPILLLWPVCAATLAAQTGEPDSLRMNRYRELARAGMFTDRPGTLRWCDSIEQLALHLDWAEQRVTACLYRIENASVFAEQEALSDGLQTLDQLLAQYRNRLKEAAWTRFQEEGYSFRGVLYYRKGDLDKTLDVYHGLENALLRRPATEPDLQQRLFVVYQLIARTYAAAGDYRKGVDYYLRSIEDRPGFTRKTMHYVNAFYQIGDIFLQQKQPDKCALYYRLALDSLNAAIRADGPDKWFGYAVNLHRRLGLFYAGRGEYNRAFEHFETALNYAKPGTPFIAAVHDNLGATYGKINEPGQALAHLRLAAALKQKLYGPQSDMMAETRLLIAEVDRCRGDYPAALRQCQYALAGLFNQPLDTNGYDNPTTSPAGRRLLSLRSLTLKLRTLFDGYRQDTSRVEWLYAARETARPAFRLMDNMRAEYTAAADKQALAGNYRALFELSIACTLRRPAGTDREVPFALAEKSKSLLLYEATQQTRALHFSGIPDSLLEQEYRLRVDIAYADKRRFELESRGALPADSLLLALNSRLFALRQQDADLQKTFETGYPDYYRLKYDLRTENIAAVQRELLYPDMALVEYFVGDSFVYIFTIGKQDYSVLELKKDFPLELWTTQLLSGLTGFQTDPDMALKYDSLSALYAEAAFNLYQTLVAPIAAGLPAKVIFIPDGILGYVPFEALLVEKPANPMRWAQHHYLINDHSISYCYSATMLREMLYRQHPQQPALPCLAFAPMYAGDARSIDSFGVRRGFRPLPHSGEEAYRIAQQLDGRALLGAAASKTAFTEQGGKARVLHLATHGQANDHAGDYGFLVFAAAQDSAENEILYARDIYNLQLNADLVTLSACETGLGEWQGGEGIISLARAFAYAGANSIVTSLWSVSDAKTRDLMIDFYKNLRLGMLKDDALRQAKLDFLKRKKGVAAHPFYWAGFVGIGNMGRIR